MSLSSRLALTTAATAAALVCSMAALPSAAAPHEPTDPGGQPSQPHEPDTIGPLGPAGPTGVETLLGHPGQTSDGEPGLVVGPPTAGSRAEGMGPQARTRNDVTWEAAPGVTVRTWVQVDGRRPIGRVRMNLITVDLDSPDISFEYLAPKYVPRRFPVSTLGRWGNVIGAVNGDFFDISDTGAPLGVGVGRTRRLVNGGRTGWIPENMSLWFDREGPHVSPLTVQWDVRQRKYWTLSGVNQPTVPDGQIGVYTRAWGSNPGGSVTEGHKRVREIIVRNNRVIANRPRLTKGRLIRKGEMLFIGTGSATKQMRTMPRGRRLTVGRRFVGGSPQMAITGDRPLLIDGVRRVINNQLAHPRTAVGIDRDGRKMLLLVVEGRSRASRGYTMVELAELMKALGAEDALNLDGGGSSAMYSRLRTGEMGLVNKPSDGAERRVPNALGIVYDGDLPPIVPPVPTPTPTPTIPTPTMPTSDPKGTPSP